MICFEVLLLAFALSIDAFVVSFSCGLTVNKKQRKNAIKMAAANGFAQFLMPVLGWFGTSSISEYVKSFDHWIVFLVFLLLGINFIKEAMREKDEEEACKLVGGTLSLKILIIASFATSVDAFAAGISIYFMQVSIWVVAFVIGVITFINSYIGFRASKFLRKIPAKYIEVAAGAILITLGTKILIEHLLGYA